MDDKRTRVRRASEYAEQRAVIQWGQQPHIRERLPELKLLFHIKNEDRSGESRNVAIDRANGVRKGVPDLCLPVARGVYHGLYIEMKSPTGRVRPEQEWWLNQLREQGYHAVVCYCWQDAVATIERYLEREATP